MLRADSPAGTPLSPKDMHTIMPCEGNFTLSRIDAEYDDGKTRTHVFNPPYRLRNGEDYAIYQTPDGAVQLWHVERALGGTWHWVQEAVRLGVVPDAEATRH